MRLSKASFAAGAAAALVLGSGTAFAATGGSFILGKSNSASTVTTLTNGAGTALVLNSKAGQPSLKVNRTTKVPNLNADLLDGRDSTSFALAGGKTGTVWSDGGVWLDVSDPADGIADGGFAFVSCPAGTVLTGGGGEDDTAGGTLWLSEAVGTGVCGVSSSTTPPADTPDGTPTDEIWAMAQCYNPKGSVPGASYRKGSTLSPAEVFKAKAAKKLAD